MNDNKKTGSGHVSTLPEEPDWLEWTQLRKGSQRDMKNVPISPPKISGSGQLLSHCKSIVLSGNLHLIDSIIKSNQISIENEKNTKATLHVHFMTV